MLPSRMAGTPSLTLKLINVLRTFGGQGVLGRLRGVRARLRSDADFRAFHEGRTQRLPDFYRQQFASRLGRYAELISDAEMIPQVEPLPPRPVPRRAQASAGAAASASVMTEIAAPA